MKELSAERFGANKPAEYLRHYEALFAPIVDDEITLLEIGVQSGASLKMWADYFAKGRIVGIDIDDCAVDGDETRIRFHRGEQQDIDFLDRVAREEAPGGFDVIIDDAAHIGWMARASFRHLFRKHLKPGGLYVIEDWGTGFWDRWPDGRSPRTSPFARFFKKRIRSHDYGMVGMVKELVDEIGRCERAGGGQASDFAIDEIVYKFSQVFVRKQQASGRMYASPPQE